MATLDDWWKLIEKDGAIGWPAFYNATLGRPIYNRLAFDNIVDMYGPALVFHAIAASAQKKFTVDPLPYVAATVRNMWADEYAKGLQDEKYKEALEDSKQRSLEVSRELDAKIKKAREEYGR